MNFFKFFKKKKEEKIVTNCKKCNRFIEDNEQTYNGMCVECYREYMTKKIKSLIK